MTLEPGDIIATGTPEGVGPLRPGDVVEVEIPGIGSISNPSSHTQQGSSARMIQLASRFTNFPAYPLADVPQIKRELAARGVDVIDLGAGDADLAPPPPPCAR
jgi:protein involved in polysaccharide export with SLBB domain